MFVCSSGDTDLRDKLPTANICRESIQTYFCKGLFPFGFYLHTPATMSSSSSLLQMFLYPYQFDPSYQFRSGFIAFLWSLYAA